LYDFSSRHSVPTDDVVGEHHKQALVKKALIDV
jgi:hypothetical protein